MPNTELNGASSDEDVDVESVDGQSDVDELRCVLHAMCVGFFVQSLILLHVFCRGSLINEDLEIGVDVDVKSVGGESDLERLRFVLPEIQPLHSRLKTVWDRSESQEHMDSDDFLQKAVELSRIAATPPRWLAVECQSPLDVHYRTRSTCADSSLSVLSLFCANVYTHMTQPQYRDTSAPSSVAQASIQPALHHSER